MLTARTRQSVARPAAGSRAGFGLEASIAALLFIPSAVRFLLNASSLAAGLVAACALTCVVVVAGVAPMERARRQDRYMLVVLTGVFIVSIHTAIASLWFPASIERAGLSLGIASFAALTAILVKSMLAAASDDKLYRMNTVLCVLFFGIVILSLAGIQPPAPEQYGKPAFPFTEPSHLALSFVPFLTFQCVRGPLVARAAWLISTLGLAYLLQNLSLVVGVAVAAACCLSTPLLLIGLAAVSVVVANLDTSYFADRLDLSQDTTNLSTLVYRQGVELVTSGFDRTDGWGIGFQQLGFVPINVPTSDIIYRLLRDDANLRDGGFLAAKLLSEFGYVGVALLATYVAAAARAVLTLRRVSAAPGEHDARITFALCMVAGFSIEMFVRGIGYFTGTAILLLASVFLLNSLKRAVPVRPDLATATAEGRS